MAKATAAQAGDAGTVSVRFLDIILSRAEREGLDRRIVASGAALDDIDFSRPDDRVTVARDAALWHFLARFRPDSSLGVRIGAGAVPRDYGLAGYAMAFSATLGDAIARLVKYHHLISQAILLRLSQRPDAFVVTEGDIATGVDIPIAIDYALAALLSVCRALTGVSITPVEVTFTYPRPASTLEHRRWFACPLHFGAQRSSIALRRRDCALLVPQGDETLAGYLSDYAEQMLRTLTRGSSVTERARAAIWAQLSSSKPSVSTVAKALDVAPRTLQRRLAQEGTSVHGQVEHLRKSMATAILRDPSRSIDDVAFLLGYTEPSSFYRSFKRWTGQTPQEYRRQAA